MGNVFGVKCVGHPQTKGNARNSWHDSKYRLLRSSWDTQTCWFNLTVVFEAVSVGYVPFALSLMQFLLCLSRRPDDSLHLPAVDYCNSQRQLSESFVQNPRKPHGDKPALHERWNHSGEAFCCDEKTYWLSAVGEQGWMLPMYENVFICLYRSPPQSAVLSWSSKSVCPR